MRARGLLLALALVASACSDTPRSERDNAGPTTTAVPSRVLGEPGESSDLSRDEAPEGIAFENDPSEDPDRSAGAPERATAAEEAAADATAEGSELGVGQEADATAAPSSAAAPLTELDLLIDELIAFVEAERGYSFKERPVVELLDNAAFGAAWTELIANDVVENRSDYDNYTDIYQTMGIIDDGSTLEQIWQRFGDAGVIGYYDPATGVITLRNGEVNAFTETVLVHELVHALEDQIFDLDRPEYGDDGGELSWTFSALTEGSARRIESAYRASFSSDQLAEEADARRAVPRSVSMSEFTSSFLELQFGRYRYGETFVTEVWKTGQSSLDDALENPPETSEAVLDPALFLSGADGAEAIRTPPADGEVFETGVWGEAAWAALLADLTAQSQALAIADGWNGDAFVAYRQGDTSCVRIHLAADSPRELDEYATALEDWATLAENREIFYPTADLIRLTACA